MCSNVPINEFIGEVEDLLFVIDMDLDKISQSMDNQEKIAPEVFNNLYRNWNYLKGLFSLFYFQEWQAISSALENLFNLLSKRELKIKKEIIDLTKQVVSALKTSLQSNENQITTVNELLERAKNLDSSKN
ncbi:MAG: hypothetical protein GF365_05520 [Candidatus Buchananbacteria bacterium]|nr:hypothetical protein [Candidatus Buchananbacteria bacterium]